MREQETLRTLLGMAAETCRRLRRALPHEVTIAEIERCCGTQFDKNVAFAFLEGIEEFRAQKIETGESVPE